ncbi:NAD(P)/FAD-dependent oxidoreductase [Terriglobus sp. TAA 43]|uniref:NAD(P)/FAD-dependent oxidoreductase n=1 Tax=Terriglobus sp. TAA 43 TaxID=278961 RepID=UPI000646E161|nr:NAD(P)/FAD-dependent oxidoreductase [Terriglobus sp. TAA 43]
MQNAEVRQSHIAVIGGGFTGMVCAFRLLRAGYRVTILEREVELGGLSATQSYGSFNWDRFYHCILTSDKPLLGLIKDLGLEDQLRWNKTEVGLFAHGELHRMTGPTDLLRYRHLSLLSKARLAIMTWYITRLTNGRKLEGIPLCQWTRRLFGKNVYSQIWEPLLRCKLGEMRKYASAAFLWGTIVRLASTREKGPGTQECLGYMHGGYETLFKRLQHTVNSLHGETSLGVDIRSIGPGNSDVPGENVLIRARHKDIYVDGVVLTTPNRVVANMLQVEDHLYKERLGQVTYLGIVCTVLVLKRKLSPYYVTNVAEKIGFTGVIEMTNLIDPQQETNGRHLVYLPRYTSPTDPLFAATDDAIWEFIQPDLKRIFPDLQEEDIESRFVFRHKDVQPVPTIDYSTIAPPARTPVAGVYLANTAQIINNTLNNNAMTSIAETTCDALMQDIPAVRHVESAAKVAEKSPLFTETQEVRAACTA